MSTNDSRYQQHANDFEAAQNSRLPHHVLIDLHGTLEGEPGRESGLDGYTFTLSFERVGAARLPVNWIICAMESYCIPLEQVDFDYCVSGCVAATFHVGRGQTLTRGMRQFIEWMATAPRVPAFEWSLEVLPHCSRIAAESSSDPVRFQAVGMEVRHILLSQARVYMPDACVPCAGDSGMEATSWGRDRARNLLASLRSGLARSLAMKLRGRR